MEYNGPQHYKFFDLYHKSIDDFHLQQLRDNIKRELCKDNNIYLIEFPHFISEHMNQPEKIQNFIIKEFESKTNIKLPKIRQFNHLRAKLD